MDPTWRCLLGYLWLAKTATTKGYNPPGDNLRCYFLVQLQPAYMHLLFAKTAANTKATKAKTEHVQITTVHGFR